MLYQICTHHRCGTVLARNTFRIFAEKNGMVFYKGAAKNAPHNTSILQSAHSRKEELSTAGVVKGIHLFRNPIEMLSSHIKYHEKSDSPLEASNKLMIEGVLYKEYLAKLGDFDEKAIFEIKHIFGRTLRTMLAWDYSDTRYLNINLSEFRAEKLKSTCEKISEHFEFDYQKQTSLLSCFNAANNNKAVKEKHVTSVKNSKVTFSDETMDLLNVEFPSLKNFMETRF
jgi:hypothetical protein